MRLAWNGLGALLAALSAACAPGVPEIEPAGAAVGARPAADARRAVTILYTNDEHGWALPFVDDGEAHGGAAELLAHLVANEGHCPRADCDGAGTVLLSGGDSYTGPAISTYFRGESMAVALGAMGYAASALGNHELDFGLPQFESNRRVSGVAYVSANARLLAGASSRLAFPPAVVVRRRGVRIGVIGLTTESTPYTANPHHFEGVEFDALEAGLARGVAATPDADVDVRVVIAHECAEKLAPVIAKHPEWRFAFVGAGHCHRTKRIDVGGAAVVAPGWRFSRYARTRVETDLSRAPGDRLLQADTEVVTFSRPEAARPARDQALGARLDDYSGRLDAALGETVGWVARELKRGSPELEAWLVRATRDELKVDVALMNRGCLRQSIPAGPLTKKTIYSVLPFDNTIVVARVTGADLARHLATEDAIYAGARVTADGRFVLASGQGIDPKRVYTVATTDFVYEGGDKFTIKASDPGAKYTGIDWRTPVIDWTRRRGSTSAAPLDSSLGGS